MYYLKQLFESIDFFLAQRILIGESSAFWEYCGISDTFSLKQLYLRIEIYYPEIAKFLQILIDFAF